MKKSFQLEIKTPCNADLEAMDKTANGFFCHLCTKDVIDLSHKTDNEIAKFIFENKNKSICARVKNTHLEKDFEYNEISKSNNLKYAVAVAASVLLTSNVVAQEKTPPKTEQNASCTKGEIVGKVAYTKNVDTEISFTFKGKILNENTKKPLSEKLFPNLTIYTNGSQEQVKIDPKTGEFSISVTTSKNAKELYFNINSNDFYLEKTIPLNSKSIKKNVLNQTIMVNPKNFHKMYIAGGLGVVEPTSIKKQ